MNNIPAIIIANGAATVLLAVVMFSAWKTVHIGLFDHKLFMVALLCSLIQSVVEPLTFLLDGHVGLEWLSIITNCILYINNICFAFIWTLYADYKLYSDTGRLKRIYKYLALPALIMIIGVIINFFTPVFFEIADGNIYMRTKAFTLLLATIYFYLLYGAILVYTRRDKAKRYLFMPVATFILPIFVGTLLQYLFYGYSLIGIGTAIGLASVYINVQNEVSLTDQLTGLFTRQYLMRFLNTQIKSFEEGKTIAGIMLDIDRFKSINDTYGHLIGDEALVKAGEIIHESIPHETVAARYAGDEFIIVITDESRATALEIIERINNATKIENASGKNKYELGFSAGYSRFSVGDSIETFMRRIDIAMYESKKANSHMKRRSTD